MMISGCIWRPPPASNLRPVRANRDADAPEGDPDRDNVHIVRGPRSFEAIREADPKLRQSVCHMLDLSIDRVYESIRAVADSRKAEPACP